MAPYLCRRCDTLGVTRPADHWHHLLPRSAGGPNTAENLIPVCFTCHRWIHDHPAASYEAGWLRSRYGS